MGGCLFFTVVNGRVSIDNVRGIYIRPGKPLSAAARKVSMVLLAMVSQLLRLETVTRDWPSDGLSAFVVALLITLVLNHTVRRNPQHHFQ